MQILIPIIGIAGVVSGATRYFMGVTDIMTWVYLGVGATCTAVTIMVYYILNN